MEVAGRIEQAHGVDSIDRCEVALWVRQITEQDPEMLRQTIDLAPPLCEVHYSGL